MQVLCILSVFDKICLKRHDGGLHMNKMSWEILSLARSIEEGEKGKDIEEKAEKLFNP